MRLTMYSCSSSSQCAELLKKKGTERMGRSVQCFVNKGGRWATHTTGTRWDQQYGDYMAVCAPTRNTMTAESKNLFNLYCKIYAPLCQDYPDMVCMRDAMEPMIKAGDFCRGNFNLLTTTGSWSWSWRGFTNHATSTSDD